MQERTTSYRQDPGPSAGRPDTRDTGSSMTIPMSLIDAVMDVDAAIDDGGLQLQEALARMHEELAHIIPGPDQGGGTRSQDDVPVSPEHASSRT